MKETLSIPEEYLKEVIKVIQVGLKTLGEKVDPVVEHNLKEWCKKEKTYLKELEANE